MKIIQKFRNDTDGAIELQMEPWGDTYDLLPNESLTLEMIDVDDQDQFQFHFYPGGMSIWPMGRTIHVKYGQGNIDTFNQG